MIGIYQNDTTRIPMAYMGLTINNDDYPVGIASVSHKYDSVTEPHAQSDGMEAYDPRRMTTMVRIDGMVKGDSMADLHDKIEALNTAFDPVLAAIADADSEHDIGFMPFTFSIPTTDTETYESGLIPMIYFARSQQLPVARISKYEGYSCPFTIILETADPRRYATTSETAEKTGQGIVAINNPGTYPSWPIITITPDKSYSSSQVIYLAYFDVGTMPMGAGDIYKETVLNIQGYGLGDVITIDAQRRIVYVNGVEDMSLIRDNNPGAKSSWFQILPGSHDLNVGDSPDNWTGEVEVSWVPAFV